MAEARAVTSADIKCLSPSALKTIDPGCLNLTKLSCAQFNPNNTVVNSLFPLFVIHPTHDLVANLIGDSCIFEACGTCLVWLRPPLLNTLARFKHVLWSLRSSCFPKLHLSLMKSWATFLYSLSHAAFFKAIPLYQIAQ